MYNNFSTKHSDSYSTLCVTLMVQLSQRVLKALKNEYCDDSKFAANLIKLYQQLTEIEEAQQKIVKNSEFISELVKYCNKNYSVRSSSNYRSGRKFTPDTARTPNFSKLDRILEESPKLNRTSKKTIRRPAGHHREHSSHNYYESMMSKYLKMTLKTPIKPEKKTPSAFQVQMTDGMFFRLF